MLALLDGYPLRSTAVKMTLDGEEANSLFAPAPFTFYIDTSFGVSWLHPLGGAVAGGTVVHLYLVDSRLLLDLGGERYGPACRFAYSEPSPSLDRMIPRSTLVRANLTNCEGQRECGAGWGAMLCVAPPYTGPVTHGAADVTIEVTINGEDYTSSGRTFRYYDPSHWRIRSFAPLGGPLPGNTSMLISGDLLQPLGDTRCRFGDDPLTEETNATIESPTLVSCVSPPHWIRSDGRQHVDVSVTLNGQDYLYFNGARLFTFYALDEPVYGLSVHHITPNGGPSAGGTTLRVVGSGYADLGLGGLLCRISGEAPVAATQGNEVQVVRCTTPSVGVLRAATSEPRAVEVTVNGQLHALTSSGVPFRFFNSSAFGVSWLYPRGGPISGGTIVHLYLVDNGMLVDLGGEQYGPACRFSYSEPSASRDRIVAHSTFVRANLTSCAGQRYCGAGWSAMACIAPPYTGPRVDGASDMTVEVTVNGQDFTSSSRTFRYYDPTEWRVRSFAPLGGPLSGNTSMRLVHSLVQSLGDVRCRFGDHPITQQTNATIETDSLIACVSPPHWEKREGRQHAEVQVTLNGQDYLRFGTQARLFTFYTLDDPVYGLSVQHLSPHGGPQAGGTLVIVTGTGFAELGGLFCTFGREPAVPASLVDDAEIKCLAPASSPSTAFEQAAVELTINGQLHARTSASVAFSYYRPQDVRVSSIYPHGGTADGGTLVTVYGTGFRDLDHGSGMYCSFGDIPPLMPATVGTATEDWLTCYSPPLLYTSQPPGSCSDGVRPSVPLRLTLNGNNSADADVNAMSNDDHPQNRFTYIELDAAAGSSESSLWGRG